jgi:Uncharacterized conserved protein
MNSRAAHTLIRYMEGDSDELLLHQGTSLGYEAALVSVQEELKKEGFRVITEIDVRKTLKKKLNVDFRRYKILGACNPSFAHQALQIESRIGTMLPCNVIVQEREDGTHRSFGHQPAGKHEGRCESSTGASWEPSCGEAQGNRRSDLKRIANHRFQSPRGPGVSRA